VRGERTLPVLAREDALDGDPREAPLVLAEEVDLAGADPPREDHRTRRRLLLHLGDLALERPRGLAGDGGEPLHHLSALGAGLRQVLGLDLDRELGLARDQDLAFGVEDLASRRLDADLADSVVVRELLVALAREDLEVPEAEEDHGEDRDRDLGEHGHPHPKGSSLARWLFCGSVAIHLSPSAPMVAQASACVQSARPRSTPAAESV
jgi:hypothetical protein